MSTKPLSSIISDVQEIEKETDKIDFLRKYDTQAIRIILAVMYDPKKYEIMLPNTAPPYIPSIHMDSGGVLQRESRKIPYFVKGYGGEKLQKLQREHMFKIMLESVHRDDAELLIKMIEQKPLKGLRRNVIKKAFGDIIS